MFRVARFKNVWSFLDKLAVIGVVELNVVSADDVRRISNAFLGVFAWTVDFHLTDPSVVLGLSMADRAADSNPEAAKILDDVFL
jgi:hypothetical protein